MVQFAKENQIPFYRAPAKNDWANWSLPPKHPYDLAVVVSFGHFLPLNLLKQFQGTINVHPSLLPKYRGSSPIQYAILNNDTETGVSIIELSPVKFDAGKILKQTKIPIPKNVHFEELHEILGRQGGKDLVETIEHFKEFQEKAIVQDPSFVTLAPKIKVSDTKIFWEKNTRAEIFAKFRAFYPRVFLYTFFDKKRTLLIKILDPFSTKCSIDLPSDSQPGTPVYSNQDGILFIKCSDGWVPVTEFRVQGKKTTIARDFHNGYLIGKSKQFSDVE